MDAIVNLYRQVRMDYPAVSASADRFHLKRWGDPLEVGDEYAWFEALADSLNEEMRRNIPYTKHSAMLDQLANAYVEGTQAVQQCIDVAFVENLFWQVPHEKCTPYWLKLPLAIKQLYIGFHHHEP